MRSKFLNRGRGVFTCVTCNRSCRQTNETGDSGCCFYCYQIAGYENELSDRGSLDEHAKKHIGDLVVRAAAAGGDILMMQREFKPVFDVL